MRQELLDVLQKYEEEGDFTHVAVTRKEIKDMENFLNVTIPEQYVEFLMKCGQGGIGGTEILGFGINGNAVFADETIQYRMYGLPDNFIVIENCDEWIYCLDCADGKIACWSNEIITYVYESFEEYFLERLNDEIENM